MCIFFNTISSLFDSFMGGLYFSTYSILIFQSKFQLFVRKHINYDVTFETLLTENQLYLSLN